MDKYWTTYTEFCPVITCNELIYRFIKSNARERREGGGKEEKKVKKNFKNLNKVCTKKRIHPKWL